MSEIEAFFFWVGIVLLFELVIASLCGWLARRKGRDTVGWFLTGFFFSAAALALLLLLSPVETPGQTRRCEGCGKLAAWRATACPACGRSLEIPVEEQAVKVKRPLRSCFLYGFLFVLFSLIVLGLIGYFCVPDQPAPRRQLSGSVSAP